MSNWSPALKQTKKEKKSKMNKTYRVHNDWNFQLYTQQCNGICHSDTQHRGILSIASDVRRTSSKEQLLLKRKVNIQKNFFKFFFNQSILSLFIINI